MALRVLSIVSVVVLAHLASAAALTHIGGVRVYGRISDVTSADVRAAIKDCRGYGSPNAIEVVGKTEMHAYFPERNMGWVRVRLVNFTEPDGRTHPAWDAGYYDITTLPEAFHLIRNADAVYVFPVHYTTLSSLRSAVSDLDPQWSTAHFRAVEGQARRDLLHLLREKNWAHYTMNDMVTVGIPEPNNIGFMFRQGKNELILFFTHTGVGGTLNGERTSGMFDEEERMRNWEKRYAQPDLRRR